ncbi:MAG: Crp/Fnr family transcriptional regulator [Bacteroidales bacterium]|nr:Crp/Fnr family transcriptional regulator [Bacteroidales bacterium]
MENKINYTACTITTRHCKCFDSLSDSERQMLDDHSVQVQYKKGEVICKQGGFASHVILMEKGLAKVFITSGSNSLIIKLIPDGNFIGIASISETHNTFFYSATAYVDSMVRQIDINFFNKLLDQNAGFAREVIDILSQNSIQIYGRFFCLTQKQAYGRLADIILCLSERVFYTNEFDLPLSRKDLAELSGMSQETVIRMLNKFISEGLIGLAGKKFKVIDFERLKQISEKG